MRNASQVTVGAAIAAFLEQCEVKAAFGVISIHNMPILDAFASRGNIRFVMARGEAGAANMADAYARTSGGLGVCLTSTGTAAGNAAGALVEALTAGTPLLHLTGQIETPYLDRSLAYIHEAPDQLSMLKAISKAAFRVRSVDTAISTLKLAVQTALTAPAGPVSVEIPIDIQSALINLPARPVAAAGAGGQALRASPGRPSRAFRPGAATDALAGGRCPACRPAGTTPAGHGRGRGHQHPGAWHRPGRRHAFPRRLQPEQTGGAVLPELRRHARGGLAPARQRNPQVRTQAPASALPGRRRCHGGGPLLPQRFLRLRRFRTGPQGARRPPGRAPVGGPGLRRGSRRRAQPGPRPVGGRPWPLRFAGGATAGAGRTAISTGCATSPSPTAPGATAT